MMLLLLWLLLLLLLLLWMSRGPSGFWLSSRISGILRMLVFFLRLVLNS